MRTTDLDLDLTSNPKFAALVTKESPLTANLRLSLHVCKRVKIATNMTFMMIKKLIHIGIWIFFKCGLKFKEINTKRR